MVIHGNGALAHVMKHVCGGVIGYPITPSTEISELYEATRENAAKHGIVDPATSVQVGLRTENPDTLGFNIIDAPRVHDLGVAAVVSAIREQIGDRPVYLTFDIDCLDPAYAPAKKLVQRLQSQERPVDVDDRDRMPVPVRVLAQQQLQRQGFEAEIALIQAGQPGNRF